MALVHTALGGHKEAFEWLERAQQEHTWQVCYLKVDPAVDPLRDDSRFQDLLRRMNFPE
jgi:hypothetical protein